jgi:hypothetical protein
MTHDIDPAEVAKLVRKELHTAFPATKFSVKTSRYSGGSSIDVRWTDGPTKAEAEKVAGHFHGATFDGMQDLKEYNGSPYGNDYIFFERRYTAECLKAAAEKFTAKYGLPAPEIKVCEYGGAYIEDEGLLLGGCRDYYWSARSVILRIAEGKDN